MKTIAIYDSEHPLAVNNRCFDESIADTGAGISMNVLMYKKAKERGIDFITADKYLAMDTSPRALCVTDMVSPNTEALLKKGAYPAVCFSMESPIIAKRYYHNIKKYSGRFCHSIQFRGTNERLKSTGTKLHCMHFPVEKSFPPLSKNSWQEKKFLTLINSNKRSISKDFIGISGVKNIAKNLVFLWWKLIDPWMRAREIYIDRIEAILYFSKYRDFHLYGENWNKPIPGYGSKEQKTAEISWKGRLDYKQKKQTLNEYKFSLCFENCAFPGYISEKIFDCFQAGCIPVYFGATDITGFIPKECFIDFRDFKNFTELDKHLNEIDEKTGQRYLEIAEQFLQSTECEKFYQETFVNTVLNCLEDFKMG